MRTMTRALVVTTMGVAVAALAGCGGGGVDEPSPAASSPPPAASPSSPAPSTSTPADPNSPVIIRARLPKTLDCATLPVPETLQRTAAPPPKCGYESATDAMSVTVSLFLPRTLEQLRQSEEQQAGSTIDLTDATPDGWSFGARWPEEGGFSRTQYYLVASDAKVLECKTGTDRGEAGVAELLAACEDVRSLLLGD